MPSKFQDYEVLGKIGSGSYGTCKKIRRKSDGKVWNFAVQILPVARINCIEMFINSRYIWSTSQKWSVVWFSSLSLCISIISLYRVSSKKPRNKLVFQTNLWTKASRSLLYYELIAWQFCTSRILPNISLFSLFSWPCCCCCCCWFGFFCDQPFQILVWKELDYGNMTEAEKQMLVSEVNVLRELKHPNIVRYYDRIIDRINTTIFIVMEYCERGDLGALISKHRKEKWVTHKRTPESWFSVENFLKLLGVPDTLPPQHQDKTKTCNLFILRFAKNITW